MDQARMNYTARKYGVVRAAELRSGDAGSLCIEYSPSMRRPALTPAAPPSLVLIPPERFLAAHYNGIHALPYATIRTPCRPGTRR